MISTISNHKVLFRLGTLFCFIISFFFFVKGYHYQIDDSKTTEQYKLNKYVYIFKDKSMDSEPSMNVIETLYSRRLSDYKEDQAKLTTTFQFFMALLVMSLLMLFYRPEKLRIPIVGMEIPDILVYIFIVVAMIFTWGTFSLLMMSTIDSRMVLEQMTDQIEMASHHPISHYFSNSRVLLDQGFTDPWCTFYHDIFNEGIRHNKHKIYAQSNLFLFYAPFLGTVIGSTLTVGLHLIYRTKNMLSILLVFVAFFLISATSIAIWGWFDYSAYFFGAIWVVATCFIVFWGLYGKRKADLYHEKNKNLESE